MKVSDLISEIQNEFSETLSLSASYLCGIYNTEASALALRLPAAASLTATDEDFVISTSLASFQVDRVFCGGRELLRVRRGVFDALGETSLYAVEDGRIYTNLHGTFKISYRALPQKVNAETASTVDLAQSPTGILYLRAAMMRTVYLSLGDIEAANACTAECERLFPVLRAEVGGVRG